MIHSGKFHSQILHSGIPNVVSVLCLQATFTDILKQLGECSYFVSSFGNSLGLLGLKKQLDLIDYCGGFKLCFRNMMDLLHEVQDI